MFASDGAASCENLRLHCARYMHKVDAAAARLYGLWRSRNGWLLSSPSAKNFFNGLQHGGGIKITDHQSHRVFRRGEIAIDREKSRPLVSGDWLFRGWDAACGMSAQ